MEKSGSDGVGLWARNGNFETVFTSVSAASYVDGYSEKSWRDFDGADEGLTKVEGVEGVVGG